MRASPRPARHGGANLRRDATGQREREGTFAADAADVRRWRDETGDSREEAQKAQKNSGGDLNHERRLPRPPGEFLLRFLAAVDPQIADLRKQSRLQWSQFPGSTVEFVAVRLHAAPRELASARLEPPGVSFQRSPASVIKKSFKL